MLMDRPITINAIQHLDRKHVYINEDYENDLPFRNQVDYTTKCAKSMYFKDSVAVNKYKHKKLWGLLKDLGSSNKCKYCAKADTQIRHI